MSRRKAYRQNKFSKPILCGKIWDQIPDGNDEYCIPHSDMLSMVNYYVEDR